MKNILKEFIKNKKKIRIYEQRISAYKLVHKLCCNYLKENGLYEDFNEYSKNIITENSEYKYEDSARFVAWSNYIANGIYYETIFKHIKVLILKSLELYPKYECNEFLKKSDKIDEFSGIYIFYCKSKNMYYVGQSIHVKQRIKEHIGNKKVKRSLASTDKEIRKDLKIKNNVFIYLIDINNTHYKTLDDMEAAYIEALNCINNGYNKQNSRLHLKCSCIEKYYYSKYFKLCEITKFYISDIDDKINFIGFYDLKEINEPFIVVIKDIVSEKYFIESNLNTNELKEKIDNHYTVKDNIALKIILLNETPYNNIDDLKMDFIYLYSAFEDGYNSDDGKYEDFEVKNRKIIEKIRNIEVTNENKNIKHENINIQKQKSSEKKHKKSRRILLSILLLACLFFLLLLIKLLNNALLMIIVPQVLFVIAALGVYFIWNKY